MIALLSIACFEKDDLVYTENIFIVILVFQEQMDENDFARLKNFPEFFKDICSEKNASNLIAIFILLKPNQIFKRIFPLIGY